MGGFVRNLQLYDGPISKCFPNLPYSLSKYQLPKFFLLNQPLFQLRGIRMSKRHAKGHITEFLAHFPQASFSRLEIWGQSEGFNIQRTFYIFFL